MGGYLDVVPSAPALLQSHKFEAGSPRGRGGCCSRLGSQSELILVTTLALHTSSGRPTGVSMTSKMLHARGPFGQVFDKPLGRKNY